MQSDSLGHIPCCSVSATEVSEDQRTNWCYAQQSTCHDLCGVQSISGNACNVATLDYTCHCPSGILPNLTESGYTVPGLMCQNWATSCGNATGYRVSESACIAPSNAKCGNKTAEGTTGADPSSRKAHLSSGTIAGIVVGVIGALSVVGGLAILYRRRRKARAVQGKPNGPGAADSGQDEKQVALPGATPYTRPKLDIHSHDASLPQVVDHSTSLTYYPSHATAVELHSTTRPHLSELYTPYHQSTELPGAEYHNTAELYSPISPPQASATAPPYAQAPVASYQHQTLTQAYQQQPSNEIHELYPRSPAPDRAVVQRQLSSDEITALEEEERRIDAEMEEVRRMKELRNQKMAVQQKLREAKG